MQSGNSFHFLAAKYVKELRPKLVVLGLQRDKMLFPVDCNRRTEVRTYFSCKLENGGKTDFYIANFV